VIQLGSILSILFLYSDRIFIRDTKKLFNIWSRLAIAFIPTGLLGLLLYKHIKALFVADTVAYMLIIGGIVLILIELFHKVDESKSIKSIEEISYKKAFIVGLFQSLAMIPGTSRSASTIVGGLFMSFERKMAIEFSFLLALPTMLIASIYDIYKNFHTLDFSNSTILAIGFVSAFVFAVVAIKSFILFISKFNFIPFGIYRIIIGILFLTLI
jgi:undecaprenyl-diphosphatase